MNPETIPRIIFIAFVCLLIGNFVGRCQQVEIVCDALTDSNEARGHCLERPVWRNHK